MKFNGWQRLWVFICLIYGTLWAIVFLNYFPTRTHLISFWYNDVQSYLFVNDYDQINMNYMNFSSTINEENEKKLQAIDNAEQTLKSLQQNPFSFKILDLIKLHDKYMYKLNHLLTTQAEYTIQFILYRLVIPMATLYIFGWLIGWVYRGFKTKLHKK